MRKKPNRPVRKRKRFVPYSQRVNAVLRRAIERRQIAHLWGQPYWITPRLIGKQFGDGEQLIYFATMNHRPNYYVVRVDSATSLDNGKFSELHDRVCEAIEEDFGRADYDYDGEYLECPKDFPAFADDSGTFWGRLSWVDVLMDFNRARKVKQ